jgi:molybdopterin/thiamine biosynthesis adenylyltransferase
MCVYRMKESKVLVINLTGSVTELIRHLVLSGINLEIVNDGKVVEAHNAEEDFLIDAQTDLGKYVNPKNFYLCRQALLLHKSFQK